MDVVLSIQVATLRVVGVRVSRVVVDWLDGTDQFLERMRLVRLSNRLLCDLLEVRRCTT